MARLSRRWRRSRSQLAVVLLSGALVCAYGASAAFSLRQSYLQTTGNAARALRGIARAAEIGTAGSLFEIDAMLVSIERLLATVAPAAPLDAPAVATVLREFAQQNLEVGNILILDRTGRLANQANPPGGAGGADTGGRGVEYRGRAFFTAHRADMPPTLFVGAPERESATAPWSVMLSRPLYRGGAFIGVIAAEVPVATFADFYNAVSPASRTRIALLRDDGVLVAGGFRPEPGIGQTARFAAGLTAAAAVEKAGLLTAAGEGAEGAVAFRRVPGRPLIVAAFRDKARILERWYREAAASLFGFAVFALTVSALAWLAVRALCRAQFAAAHLRRSEARLKRQTALLQSTLENIGEGLSVFDSRGRLIARNLRFCDLLDLSPDLSAGTSLADILRRQARRGDFGEVEVETEVARRLDRFYRDVPIVKERLTLSGQTLQIRRRNMPDGAVLSIYSDVTEIKAAERKIIQARSEAEFANRSKSEFLANMSHELRTPLNAIIGFSEIICNQLFGAISNDRYLEYMNDIHSSSLHLLSIINDVLDMSKIEAGKLELFKEPIALNQVIGDVVRMMRERAQSGGVEIVCELGRDDAVIRADERAMRQILLNLLSNAIKFSPPGGVVSVRLDVVHAGLAVLEIEDHGIGMDEEEQQRALQPFGQAKPVITRQYGGTGLGLPITKGLVEAHGGTLTIRSRPGEGTTIRVVLAIEPGRENAREILAAQELRSDP